MSEPTISQDNVAFAAQAREIRRALLVTAFLERRLPDGSFKHVQLSDQMRRFLSLANEMSYGAESPSDYALFASRRGIARCLSMDEADVRALMAKAEEFGLIAVEDRGDGFLWVSLRLAQLAVVERALVARAAIDDAELAQRDHLEQLRLQLSLIAPSHDQGRGYGFASALDAEHRTEDMRTLAALSKAVSGAADPIASAGKVPAPRRSTEPGVRGESPHLAPANRPECGESPRTELPSAGSLPAGKVPACAESAGEVPAPPGMTAGRLPAPSVPTRVRARGDSPPTPVQIVDSSESSESGAAPPGSGHAAGPPSGRRFRDGGKNYLFEELVRLDEKRELQDEICRRKWVGRIRDEPHAIDEAIGEVKQRQNEGEVFRKSILGAIYSKARMIAKELGRELRSFFFL